MTNTFKKDQFAYALTAYINEQGGHVAGYDGIAVDQDPNNQERFKVIVTCIGRAPDFSWIRRDVHPKAN